MNSDLRRLRNRVLRHKKTILIGGASLIVLLSIIIAGVGVLVYKSAVVASETVKTYNWKDVRSQELPELGFVKGMVLGVAGGWLEQATASAEVQSLKYGLSCIDALGGPSPVDIVAYVESRTSDKVVLAQLGGLKEELKTQISPASGPAACASWIVNS